MTFRMMVSTAAGAVLGLGLLTAAASADAPPAAKKKAYLPAKAAYAAPAAPAHYERPHIGSWSGLYFGANAGYAWGNVDWQYVDPAGPTGAGSYAPSAAALGGHIGIQHQYDNIVVGIEVSYSGGFADKIDDRGQDTPAFAAFADAYARINSIFTVGPRLGLAVAPDWLVYATGGYASAQFFTHDIIRSSGSIDTAGVARHNGWFIGGGVERKLHDRWIVGVEYLYMDFETERHASPNGRIVFGGTRDIDGDVSILRARLSYKLGRDGHAKTESYK